ncbi:MAG: prephenate dehydratase [Verrucomicrobiota bacterium]
MNGPDPLEALRKQIDEVDSGLLEFLSRRADLVHEVGEIKKKDGLQIYAPEREEKLLQSLIARNEGRLPEKSIRAIYREIMSAALALEEDLAIAYLGPEGTWTHQAAINKFGGSVRYAPQANFAEVFDQVARGKADYGVVPIENSTEGAVSHTLDLFADSPLKICAQVLLHIENNLMATEEAGEIRTLYSHPQVFGQCRNWLQLHYPEVERVEVSSTTRAAQIAKEEAHAGALGGKLAADLYGLRILESSVQDSATNTTRFLVLGNETCPATGNDRTSIMFALQDKPGALYKALKPFDEFDINMSKIESRPSKKRDWEYFFFVDLKGHCGEDRLVKVLEELESHCSFFKLLGSYPEVHSQRSASEGHLSRAY